MQTKIISSIHKLDSNVLSFFGWSSVSTNDAMKEIPMTAPKNIFLGESGSAGVVM